MATLKVEIAEFIVLTEMDHEDCDDDYLVNYGRQFMLFFDACPNAFGGLTSLHLENLRFGGSSDIPNVLIACKRLKHLRLFNCDSRSCTVLQVEHSQISELAIVDCSFERVELSLLPKLRWFTFEGWISYQDPLSFGYVPLLEAVGLTNVGLSWHKMVKLSKFLGDISVRDLKLGFDCEKIWVEPEYLTGRLTSVFRQLRFVNLVEIPEGYGIICVKWTRTQRKGGHSYSEEKRVDWKSPASDFQHHNLATLTIFGFQFEDYMERYVRRVMEAAVNLEDAFLYHTLACRKCHDNSPKPFRFPFTKMHESSMKKRITKGIDSSAMIHFPTGGVIRADHRAKMMNP